MMVSSQSWPGLHTGYAQVEFETYSEPLVEKCHQFAGNFTNQFKAVYLNQIDVINIQHVNKL